tara:strand:+ start:259 stop:450 length:192 start_codon:yes stop_codon:yes gene_type:complete
MPEKMDNIIIDQVIDLFEKKDFKKKLISKLNEDVDIPLINEKTEKKILDKIYDLIVKSMNELK